MKLSVAIAGNDALASAFVVWRGFESSMEKAKRAGYDGVELALRSADEISPARLRALTRQNDLEISAISTGQIFADGGLSLSDESPAVRAKALGILRALLPLAAEYGRTVNLGRVRGGIASLGSRGNFLENAARLCEEAAACGVTILLEPINRYESNFINSLDEGARLIRESGIGNLKLMPDVFHMNIEDDDIAGSLARNARFVHYIHLADSNRHAPGRGHLDFPAIFAALRAIGFDGWTSVEILPTPTPDEAALEAARFLLPYVKGGETR